MTTTTTTTTNTTTTTLHFYFTDLFSMLNTQKTSRDCQ